MISLIANSGIQFHSFDIVIDLNEDVLNRKLGFYEYVDNELERIMEYAYYFPDEDLWVRKADLAAEGFLDKKGKPDPLINFNTLLPLNPSDCYRVNDLIDCFDSYADIWLPIPYFRQENIENISFGPTAWARMLFTKTGTEKNRIFYKVTLAFDTKVGQDIDNAFIPNYEEISGEQNYFVLSNNDDLNLNFLSERYGCGWVLNYLQEKTHRSNAAQNFKFAAKYLVLVRYLSAKSAFPEVKIFPDKEIEPIDVDLVLDIGNANTCGLLFESPEKGVAFKFDKVKKLKLVNLSNPAVFYDDPFDMRLAFSKANFGGVQIPQYPTCFSWPSFVRVGKEAKELISKHAIGSNSQSEKLTHHSSPKRYLWDNNSSDAPWDFVTGDPVYLEGLSEFFKENGEFVEHENDYLGVLRPYYSRKSLLTFVYLEIFLHALAQVNSLEFRNIHGEKNRPRRLRRVTITCPTAIIQEEQISLRRCAVEAAKVLNKISGNYYSRGEMAFEVIPSVKDLSKNLTEVDDREDWIYDEATCCQLVFLYGEISKRYLNNANLFFDLYGKKRNDVEVLNAKALTIGTIDIGGGTTDLMICTYQNSGQSEAVLKPQPLYWESFTLAGDDLMKELIQQIILEGTIRKEEFRGCTGVIENYAREKGCSDVVKKMNNFFGSDSNRMDGEHKSVYRKNFIVQIAKPIAERFIEHACGEEEDREIGFDELFTDFKPNAALLQKFNDHFSDNGRINFRFEDIRWKLSKKRVFEILENTYDPLFKQLSILLYAYGCDFLLLTGQITKVPKIRELFMKFYAVSPDRIISLNNYRIGRWYPYADDVGRFEHPKTIVAVGALIALMSGKLDNLEGFRLQTKLLKTKLLSTANYMGALNRDTYDMDNDLYFTPQEHRKTIVVGSLPLKMGYKQLGNPDYPGKPIYQLTFNYEEICADIKNKNPNLTEAELKEKIDRQEKILRDKMPFQVKITRSFVENKEQVFIEEVLDTYKDEVSKKWLKLSYMTLPEPKGYWLDTGEFFLNIK